MIKSLTAEQKTRFPEFVAKWTQIGLSTEPLNMKRVQQAFQIAFAQVNKPAPKAVHCTSPLAACLTRGVLASVRESVRASVLDSVSASVRESVSASVRDSVSESVRDSVSASVSESVRASVLDSVSASVSAYWWYDFGQYASYWLSFYDYCHEVLGVDNAKLSGNEAICCEAGWSWVFWKLALVSEKPIAIHRNARGQLHKDGALALEHSDGWGVYALNGIRMKSDYILTPAEKISPETVLAETNADIRRELIRKVGIERMLAKLPHKRMDKRGNYELLSINLGNGATDARYLRMLNPSVGVWHLEGVAPECDTITKSLNWRNQHFHTNAEILT
jgi:hypothetical protein